MQGFTGLWRRLLSHWESARFHGAGNPRRQRLRPDCRIAAEIEKLQSRELLSSVTYHGGALISNVEVQNVYLGSDWQTSRGLKAQEARLNAFSSMLVQSTFMDGLTLAGYNVYRGTSSPSVVVNMSLDKTVPLDDSQIQTDLQALIKSGKVQDADPNRLYLIYVEPGMEVTLLGASSRQGLLGYHGAFAGKTTEGTSINIHYAVMVYPGFPNPPGNSTQNLGHGAIAVNSIGQLTIVTSHELAEAVTDPDAEIAILGGSSTLFGWRDDTTGEEVGDIVQNFHMIYKGFEIQAIATQQEAPISFNAITQKLTAPTGLALAPGNSASTGVLSWGASPLAQGYRIFQIIGGQRIQIGSTDASTASFKLSNLQTGVPVSFLVEAFNSSLTADSAVITGTPPFA